MIILTFNLAKEIMKFRISEKQIFYTDRIWINELRCIPRDEEFIKKIRESRNRFSSKLIDAFTLSKEQQQEYDSANSEEELAQIIIKDMGKKGGKLIKKEKREDANA